MRFVIPFILVGACSGYQVGEIKDEDPGPTETTPTETTPAPTAAPEIEVSPGAVNFGFWPLECTSQREVVTIQNVGDADLIVSSIDLRDNALGVYRIIAVPDTVPPGTSMTFELDFTPVDYAVYAGPVVQIWSNDTDETLVEVTLRGEGADDGIFVDQFQQTLPNQLDVLWVIDNSGSMSGEIDHLSDTFHVFINGFVALGLDFQIGVVTTDMDNPLQSGRLQGAPTIITSASSDPVADFALAVNQGSSGSGDERGLDAAYAALTSPLIDAENLGIVRPGSHLSVIVVTDENDSSSIAPASFASWLEGYQGDPALTAFSAVAGPTSGLFPCFAFFSGVSAEPAPRYWTAVSQTGGIHLSICDMDMGSILTSLSIVSAGLQRTFALTLVPDDAMLIEVTVDGVPVPKGLPDGATYNPATNSVTLNGASIPPPGATVEISYPTVAQCPT